MRKVFIVAAVATCLSSTQAFAQAKGFEGFSLLGGLNVATSKVEASVLRPTAKNGLKASNSQSESTKSNLALEAQYAAALGDKFVLAAGFNLGAGDLSFGDASYGEVKLKETASVFLKPGYALSDSSLVFVKLAALRGKATLGSQSDSISGNGYGLGVQVRSGKNVFYQVEWNQNRYDDLSTRIAGRNGTERLSSNALTFGVGYKF